MADRIIDWDLISRPVATRQFVHHGVGTLTRMAALMSGQLDRLATHGASEDGAAVDRTRQELARKVTAFRAGQERDAWHPVVAGREFCLARHLPQVYAVIDRRAPAERGDPVPADARINWFARLTHDGWCHWTYVWETGRFHYNEHLFDGLHGAEPHLELVPLTLTEFRSRLARHDRKTVTGAFVWASATVERCAPELLLDGPLPTPRI
ncbi:hypothetical protein [Granulicoccus sp. GXG6511]|uniref:hypothetical protein n=1 Tax=Granulicoccus sp. GXG6511 TaxID=3381351 RepID=UPI003D7EA9E4